jgi:hypothetical protein
VGTNDWKGGKVDRFGGAAAVSEESAGTTQNACSSFLQDSTTARQQPKNRPSKTVKRASQPNAGILLEETEAERGVVATFERRRLSSCVM